MPDTPVGAPRRAPPLSPAGPEEFLDRMPLPGA